ncbi:T9SS type A sorting domain-containing protein [Flavobacterium sp.]|uniref:T9SS type A sorting domain-containing protein n=1 Tax=Flavobacterium sp. TaxID=239 RepID=UPI002869FFC8|nr:T9SS type A sorting domain-containing protein [Flavobacterium sp.]
MKTFIYCFILFLMLNVNANAQAWPASPWSNGINLTNIMDVDGVTDLSGLHFNTTNNRLYCVQGDGHLRVLLWDTLTNTYTQIANKTISGGPEGITQANLYANEFYTIDENNYAIKRYTHTASFSSVTEFKHWNLLNSPSPMQDTGNTGPEGIVFVPDSFLSSIGFISQQTGQLYTSVKGLGGLFFVAHQDEGYVWVFDVNPNTNNDFAYVGKYKTNQEESCDLAFDRSTGLMYILHNISGNNKLEVTNLTTAIVGANRKFVDSNEYDVTNPNSDNDNIEGFALTPKCLQTGAITAWLCRDVESNEDVSIQQDALRWFNPFDAPGTCIALSNNSFEVANVDLYPNPVSNQLTISGSTIENATIKIYNNLGQLILEKENKITTTLVLDVASFETGIYFLEINQSGNIQTLKFSKQ